MFLSDHVLDHPPPGDVNPTHLPPTHQLDPPSSSNHLYGQAQNQVNQDPLPSSSGDSRSSDKVIENYSCEHCDKQFNVRIHYAIRCLKDSE